MIRLLFFIFIFIGSFQVSAQRIVKGKVTDAETGDPIPFASVLLKGTSVGKSTDFEGNFIIESSVSADSLQVTIWAILVKQSP